jgi:hypothetical protein
LISVYSSNFYSETSLISFWYSDIMSLMSYYVLIFYILSIMIFLSLPYDDYGSSGNLIYIGVLIDSDPKLFFFIWSI